jgi:hypothetical protein
MILDENTATLVHEGTTVALTGGETHLLAALVAYRGSASFANLITRMWPSNEPDNAIRQIRQYAYYIRGKTLPLGWPLILELLHSHGYRLLVPLRVTRAEHVIILPADDYDLLRRLLRSHPNRADADKILELVG